MLLPDSIICMNIAANIVFNVLVMSSQTVREIGPRNWAIDTSIRPMMAQLRRVNRYWYTNLLFVWTRRVSPSWLRYTSPLKSPIVHMPYLAHSVLHFQHQYIRFSKLWVTVIPHNPRVHLAKFEPSVCCSWGMSWAPIYHPSYIL